MPQQLPGSRAPGFRDRSWPQRRAPPPRARSRPLLPPPTCDRPKGGDSGTAHRRGHLEPPLLAPSTRPPGGDTRAAAPCPASAPRPPGGSPGSEGCDALWGGGRGRARRGGAARGLGSAGRHAVSPSCGGAMVQAGQGGVGSGFELANFSSGQGRAPGRQRGRVSAAGWDGGQAPVPLGIGPPVWPLRPREGSPRREQGRVPGEPRTQQGQRAPSWGWAQAFWRRASPPGLLRLAVGDSPEVRASACASPSDPSPGLPFLSPPSQGGSKFNRFPSPPSWASFRRSFLAGSRGREP